MKIGYVVPEFPSQTHIFFWREIQALTQQGVEVSIVSTRLADLSAVKHDFAKPASEATTYLHPPKLADIAYALRNPRWLSHALRYAFKLKGAKNTMLALYLMVLASALRRHAKGSNIEHVHGHSCAHVAHILAMAALCRGPSYSLTLHGGLSTYGDNHRQKFCQAKFVSTVTQPLQQEVMSLMQWNAARVPVISMGVNTASFTGKPRLVDATKPLRLISVARLALGKGHAYTLQALANINARYNFEWRYTVVGNGPDEMAIKTLVEQLGLAPSVDFKGSLGEDDVVAQLEQADVLMLTSVGTFEAAPVCVMEAMASAIPTITSIIGGTQDMISHEYDGFLVEQESVQQIEHALLRLFENRELVATMGQQARERAQKQFDYQILAARLKDYCSQ